MVWQLGGQLWRTSDGGHTWTTAHAPLPMQGAMDNDDETCPNGGPFQVAFANQQDGWLPGSRRDPRIRQDGLVRAGRRRPLGDERAR
jgi:hypothetical protein